MRRCAQAIPNAWLASAKGHPFWMFCVQQVIKNAGACRATNTDRCGALTTLPLACSIPPSCSPFLGGCHACCTKWLIILQLGSPTAGACML